MPTTARDARMSAEEAPRKGLVELAAPAACGIHVTRFLRRQHDARRWPQITAVIAPVLLLAGNLDGTTLLVATAGDRWLHLRSHEKVGTEDESAKGKKAGR